MVSKILEKIVNQCFQRFFCHHYIIPVQHFGFRPNRSVINMTESTSQRSSNSFLDKGNKIEIISWTYEPYHGCPIMATIMSFCYNFLSAAFVTPFTTGWRAFFMAIPNLRS